VSKILLVVDMQEGFYNSFEENLNNKIIKKIEEFKRRNQYILFFEYTNFGKTNYLLQNAVKDYHLVDYVSKYTDSANKSFNYWLCNKNIKFREIYISGINAHACVRKTTVDLSKTFTDKKIKLLTRHIGAPGHVDIKESILDIKREAKKHKLDNLHFLK
jgi:nicotinamidase-related amidase